MQKAGLQISLEEEVETLDKMPFARRVGFKQEPDLVFSWQLVTYYCNL